jgi:hypothetical protein
MCHLLDELIFVPVELLYTQSDRVSLCLLTITLCLFLVPSKFTSHLFCRYPYVFAAQGWKDATPNWEARFQNAYCAVLLSHWPRFEFLIDLVT